MMLSCDIVTNSSIRKNYSTTKYIEHLIHYVEHELSDKLSHSWQQKNISQVNLMDFFIITINVAMI